MMLRLKLLVCSISVTLSLGACSGGASGPVALPQQQAVLDSATQPASPSFVAIKLPAGFVPFAIMKDGQVPGNLGSSAALYKDGTVTVLSSRPLCATTTATSANSKGQIVGFCEHGGDHGGFFQALLFENGTVRDLGHPTGPPGHPYVFVEPLAIDDVGDIIGIANINGQNGSSLLTRFFADGRAPKFFSHPPSCDPFCYEGTPYNLNSAGHFSFTEQPGFGFDSNESFVGFRNALTPVFARNTAYNGAVWINDADAVTGWRNAATPPEVVPQTYIHDVNGTRFLPFPSGVNTMMPDGINNRNEIVGAASGPHIFVCETFIYSAGSVRVLPPSAFTPSGGYCAQTPGLSDRGAFIAQETPGSAYYLIQPK